MFEMLGGLFILTVIASLGLFSALGLFHYWLYIQSEYGQKGDPK